MSHTYIYINILPLFPQKNSRTSDQRIAMSLPSAQTVVLKYHFPPEGTRQGFWEKWLIPSLGQNEYGRTWDILSYQRAGKLSKTVVLVKGTWETSWRPYSPSGYYLSFKKRTRIAINCNPCVNPCIHNDTVKKKQKRNSSSSLEDRESIHHLENWENKRKESSLDSALCECHLGVSRYSSS